MGMQNNSVIMAAGMSIPMPAIVNPLNTEDWKREREESQKKEAKFSSVKWAKTSCKEGEEIELSAGVKDITDGNMVTLQVFREGQSPEDSAAIAKFPLSVKGGSVFAKWSYRTNGNDIPAERNPRFIFSAHSAWCPWKKSENSLEVELRRPKIEKTEWQDEDGKAASKGTVGTPIKLYAEVTEFEEGQGVTFTVYNERTQAEVTGIGAEVKDGKAEAQWTPVDTRSSDDTGELKYYFEVTATRCKPVKSGGIQVKNPKVISMDWEENTVYYNDKIKLLIKSLEMADESPDAKLLLYEKGMVPEDEPLLELEVTINKDDLEQEVKINFEMDKIKRFIDFTSIDVYPLIKLKDTVYSPDQLSLLNIQMGDVQYE